MARTMRLRSLLLSATLLAAACSPIVDQRGYVATPGTLEKLQPGQQTRDDVLKLLGSPSTTATFNNETWYYISQRFETVAFLSPETVDQSVVELKFDQDGVLRNVKNYTLKDGQVVNMVDRTTPTAGKELTILDQIIGNIGRYGGGSGTAPGMPGSGGLGRR